jgi:hypothetical protein
MGWYLCVSAFNITAPERLYLALAFNRRNEDGVQEVRDADIL